MHLLGSCCASVFLQGFRHPPTDQIVTGSQRQPLDVLKSLAVCSRFHEVIQECHWLFVGDDFLPSQVELFVDRTPCRTEELKLELYAILIANAVTIMIFPSCLVEEFRRFLRIVR